MDERTTQLSDRAGLQNFETTDPETIRARMAQTRTEMGETLDALQTKLAPERLAQETQEKVKEVTLRKVEEMTHTITNKANTWRESVVETVKENPLPAALVGIGLGWLLIEGSRKPALNETSYYYPVRSYDRPSRTEPYDPHQAGVVDRAQTAIAENMENIQDKVSDAAHRVKEEVAQNTENLQAKANEVIGHIQNTAGELSHTVEEKASEIGESVQNRTRELSTNLQEGVRDQANYLAEQTRYQSQRAGETVQNVFQENPLAVGAVAMATGLAIGFMFPITQKEQDLMGDTRDRLVDQAQTTAKQTLDKVEQVAGEAYQAAKETVSAEIEEQNNPVNTYNEL